MSAPHKIFDPENILCGKSRRKEQKMNIKPAKTKILSVLLALCMVLSLAPIAAVATEPAAETADFTASDGGAAAIALLNRYKNAGAANSAWDGGSKTLTLRGIDFTTAAITGIKLPAGTTVILADGTENKITSGDAAAEQYGSNKTKIHTVAIDALGDLTVKGGVKGTGSLSVTSGTYNNTGDAWTFSSAIVVDGDFTVWGGHITAVGGKAYSADCAFSDGVLMTTDRSNKALSVIGGSLTAIGGETYDSGDGGNKSFSRGVHIYKGSVFVTGNGKLTAKCDPAMDGEGLAFALDILLGDLFVSNEGELDAAATYGIDITGGGIQLDGGKITATSVNKNGIRYENAILVEKSSYSLITKNAGNIKVNDGMLTAVNGRICVYAYNPNDTQGVFTVNGGTVKAERLYGAEKYKFFGGTIHSQEISGGEFTLAGADLTVREPIYEVEPGDIYVRSALRLKKLTVNSGTLDVAWDWGENTPFVIPTDEETGYPTPLVSIWGDAADSLTFNGGTSAFNTGCAGNLVLKAGQIVLGEGMAETGADNNQCQLRSDTPVRIAAAQTTPIAKAVIANAKFDYLPGEAPQKTAVVSLPEDLDKYEIAYECWEEMENGDPVAFWYSDEAKYIPSMKKITLFEEGKTYMYSVELKVKDGYTYTENSTAEVNGIKASIVIKTQSGLLIPAVKTITPVSPVIRKEIELVEINGATLTFKDGDKPVFTGSTPNGAPYTMVYEAWKTDGEGISSNEEFNGDKHLAAWGGKLITAFDKNKTYSYMLWLKTTEEGSGDGYFFGSNTKLKINGEEVGFIRNNCDGEQQFTGTADIAMTPEAVVMPPDYKIIEGANGVWVQNSTDSLVFRASGDFSGFIGVKVDGNAITADKYTAASGSTVVTLKTAFLAGLSLGKHILSVVYTDGECNTEFEIKAAPHEHSYGTEWRYDGTNHWHECAECHARKDIAEHSFEWVTDKEATENEKGEKHEECSVCHATRNEHTEIPATGKDNIFTRIYNWIVRMITKVIMWIVDFIKTYC